MIDSLRLTIKCSTVLFLHHVAKELVFTDTAITLFESKYDTPVHVDSHNNGKMRYTLDLLCRLMENTSGHEMIRKVSKITFKEYVLHQLHDMKS